MALSWAEHAALAADGAALGWWMHCRKLRTRNLLLSFHQRGWGGRASVALKCPRGARRLVMNAALADLLQPYCGFILSPVDLCYFVWWKKVCWGLRWQRNWTGNNGGEKEDKAEIWRLYFISTFTYFTWHLSLLHHEKIWILSILVWPPSVSGDRRVAIGWGGR